MFSVGENCIGDECDMNVFIPTHPLTPEEQAHCTTDEPCSVGITLEEVPPEERDCNTDEPCHYRIIAYAREPELQPSSENAFSNRTGLDERARHLGIRATFGLGALANSLFNYQFSLGLAGWFNHVGFQAYAFMSSSDYNAQITVNQTQVIESVLVGGGAEAAYVISFTGVEALLATLRLGARLSSRYIADNVISADSVAFQGVCGADIIFLLRRNFNFTLGLQYAFGPSGSPQYGTNGWTHDISFIGSFDFPSFISNI
ncbi:MAG: hypothetical protein ABH859_04995 [Pseudomonadota bacterium]